jgi:hypothetical protein
MAVAATGGLLWPEVYRESAPMVALLRGYDLVTLVVAVPALVIALLPALRNSLRARLVWLGVLGYGLYTYATYLFGTGFNAFFLLHVAIFTLSLYALVLGLWRLDASRIRDRFHVRTPVRWIAGFLGFLAVALGGMWVFYSVRFAVTGAPPAESAMVSPVSLLHLGYALDLALLVPWYLVTAVLLWRRAGFGYVFAGIALVSGTLQQLQYLVVLPMQAAAGIPGATAFDSGELPIAVGYLVAAVALLSGTRPAPLSGAGASEVAGDPAPAVATDSRRGRLKV